MRVWTRDHTTRLVRSFAQQPRNPSSSSSSNMEDNLNLNQNPNLNPNMKPNMNQNPNLNPNLNVNDGDDPRPLRECWNPTRNVQPSCITLPPTNAHHFEIKPGVINMLPKFSGTEDPYLFIREFEELCATLKLQQLTDDSIRLRLITFALRDNAKKWLYGLPSNSITTWAQLVEAFLRKYFPAHKTAKFRMDIIQTKQGENESLWQYMEKFRELLLQCPHHGFEMWRLT